MAEHAAQGFDMQLTHHDGCAVIHCLGRIVAGNGPTPLEAIGSRELCAGRRLILDLNGVVEMDPWGLGAISRLYRTGLLTHSPVVILGGDARLHRTLQRVAEADPAGDPLEYVS